MTNPFLLVVFSLFCGTSSRLFVQVDASSMALLSPSPSLTLLSRRCHCSSSQHSPLLARLALPPQPLHLPHLRVRFPFVRHFPPLANVLRLPVLSPSPLLLLYIPSTDEPKDLSVMSCTSCPSPASSQSTGRSNLLRVRLATRGSSLTFRRQAGMC
jgi:hypothetical protein